MQGGREKFDTIKADAGIPVMSHVGICPNFVHQYGGFLLQGRTAEQALEIIDNAYAIEEAGAIGLEIEAVPRRVGKAVNIFTFAIGAGSVAYGQPLMGADVMGCFADFKPKFAQLYGTVADHGRFLQGLWGKSLSRNVSGRGAFLRHEDRGAGDARKVPVRRLSLIKVSVITPLPGPACRRSGALPRWRTGAWKQAPRHS